MTDQHLLRDYITLHRIRKEIQVLRDCGEYDTDNPEQFFYNKGAWLWNRNEELISELDSRAISFNRKVYDAHPKGMNESWEPASNDYALCLLRELRDITADLTKYTYCASPVLTDRSKS